MNLDEFIHEHAQEVHVYGGVGKETIQKSSQELNTNFNEELVDYLKNYGAIECHYLEFFGLGFIQGSYLDITTRTTELRKEGLSKDCVAILDLGDSHYAIYCNNGAVYDWAPSSCDSSCKLIGNSLQEFLVSMMSNAINA